MKENYKFAPFVQIDFSTTINDKSLYVKSSTCGYNSDLISLFYSEYDYDKNWLLVSNLNIKDKLYPIPYYLNQEYFSSFKSKTDLEPQKITAGYHGDALSFSDFSIKDKIIIRFSQRKINKISFVFDKFVYPTNFKAKACLLSENDVIFEEEFSNDKSICQIDFSYNFKIRFLIIEFTKLNLQNRKLIINNIQISFRKYFDLDKLISLKYTKKKNPQSIIGFVYNSANLTLLNKDRDFDFLNDEKLNIGFGYAILKIFIFNEKKYDCQGIFVVKEWNSSEKELTTTLNCIDYFKYLENIQNYDKIEKNYSFLDAISYNLKKIGIKDTRGFKKTKEKIIDFYYTKQSISKTILDLAKASNSIIIPSNDYKSCFVFDIADLYNYPIKRVFDKYELIDYSQEKSVLNPNSIEYNLIKKEFEKKEYIAHSKTVYQKDFVKRNLPDDARDKKYFYSLGYNLTPSYTARIDFSSISIIDQNFLRVEITDIIEKYVFEYTIKKQSGFVVIDFWIFSDIDTSKQTEITVFAFDLQNVVEIANIKEAVPSQIENKIYYLNDEKETENKNQLVEPYIIDYTITDIAEIENFISQNLFLEGFFEYIIDRKSDGFFVKVWNYTNSSQDFLLTVYGRKLVDSKNSSIIKNIDAKRVFLEGENKLSLKNNIYMQNEKIVKENILSMLNIYKILKEGFKNIKIKPKTYEDFNIFANDIILIESIRGYGFLPILIEGVQVYYKNNGITIDYSGKRIEKDVFYCDDIYDTFIIEESILE